MSDTRLLVLGAIRIMQPVHGYDVRRELLSWRIEHLSNVKPGSIYGAIKTLLKDGCIAVHSQSSSDSRPEKTTYVTTGEGEKEFEMLMRETWWNVRTPSYPLIPGLCLLPFLPREELIKALGARIAQLEGDLDGFAFMRGSIEDGATGADGAIPEHVRETFDFLTGHTRAEVDWAKTLQKRLRAGAYVMSGEPDFPAPEPGRGIRPND